MTAAIADLVSTSCPVCAYAYAAPFFDGDEQPLATLGWAKTAGEARAMPRFPLDYVQCPRCTHVWNRSFSYDRIPYTNNPNRMFNKVNIWQGHLQIARDLAIQKLGPSPTVIDIGCGEGHFVRGVAQHLNGKGRFLGFDPNATAESGVGVEFHAQLFDPITDIPRFKPDLLIMRHVLEHLTNPAIFVEQLAWGAIQLNKPVLFFAEMPCIDRVLTSKRLVDFFYEHPSQFTTRSFQTLLEQGGKLLHLDHGYNGEVVYGLVELTIPISYQNSVKTASGFYRQAKQSRHTIKAQLKDIIEAGKTVAIWGGTGKAAAFIHFFDVNADQFPIVVDSDQDKVGTYVPKIGQRIQYRDVLKSNSVNIIIIPTQWRAKDIFDEMTREGIHYDQVLIEHDGKLIDFLKTPNPYR